MCLHKLAFVVVFGFGQLLASDDIPAVRAGTGLPPRPMVVGEFDRVIPQVVDGGLWKTSFILTNLDNKVIYFVALFYTNDGALMNLPIKGLGTVSAVYGSLGVNGSVTFETEGVAAQNQEGFARLFTLDRPADDPAAEVASARLGGMAIFGLRVPGRPDFEAVAPISPAYEPAFTILYDNRDGFSTGVAIVNGSTIEAPLNITIRDMNGNLIRQDSFSLGALNKITFSMPVRYPEAQRKNGIMQVFTPTIALSGLALRFNPTGAFTSAHTLSTELIPDAPAQPSVPPPTLPGVYPSCAALEGARVFASDGQYLGMITSNKYATDSMGNIFGLYGSQYSSVSIFNTFGRYGSQYSSLSPFNPYTSTPPVIFVGSTAVAYLTVNSLKTPRLSPTDIYPCIGR